MPELQRLIQFIQIWTLTDQINPIVFLPFNDLRSSFIDFVIAITLVKAAALLNSDRDHKQIEKWCMMFCSVYCAKTIKTLIEAIVD